MRVFIIKSPTEPLVVLAVRAEGDGVIGDCFIEVRPGESAFDRSYEEWADIESSSVEI